MFVCPRMWPETTETAPNSPAARAVAEEDAVEEPPERVRQRHAAQDLEEARAEDVRGLLLLRAERLHRRDQLAGDEGKRDEERREDDRRRGEEDRRGRGRRPAPRRRPVRPKRRTKSIPATTGETANGRSMRETTRLRPGKSNFPSAQPAATPATRFTGTTIADRERRQLRSAATASGSASAAR